jgi:hypothetical protein
MFLTDLEISQVNSLIAGPMAMKHLSNELEGAKSAKTALEQSETQANEQTKQSKTTQNVKHFSGIHCLFQSRFC